MDRRQRKQQARRLRNRNRPAVHVVYRPKSDSERSRRLSRAQALVGIPFVSLPDSTPENGEEVLFESSEGYGVKRSEVEMVYNDALMLDAVSNWGEDGPLYGDTLDTPTMREAYTYALNRYVGVPIPVQLRRPVQ